MKNKILLLGIFIVLSSCKGLQLSSFHAGSSLKNKIPTLHTDFDVLSFAPDYADLYNIPNLVLDGGVSMESAVQNITTELTIAEDTKRIFENQIKRNISKPTGDVKGYAVCKKGMRSKGFRTYLHPLVSVLTLGVMNVFGFPYGYLRDNLEITVEIYKNDHSLVGSYSALGEGEAKIAMYTGYRQKDAKRLAHAQAFSEAMENIKEQIRSEQEALAGLLNE